jgi:hypothetical protein
VTATPPLVPPAGFNEGWQLVSDGELRSGPDAWLVIDHVSGRARVATGPLTSKVLSDQAVPRSSSRRRLERDASGCVMFSLDLVPVATAVPTDELHARLLATTERTSAAQVARRTRYTASVARIALALADDDRRESLELVRDLPARLSLAPARIADELVTSGFDDLPEEVVAVACGLAPSWPPGRSLKSRVARLVDAASLVATVPVR